MTRDASLNATHGTSAASTASTPASVTRRSYSKPEVIAYGRVEDMTRSGKSSGKEASGKPRSA